MHYALLTQDQEHQVNVDETRYGHYTVTIDGRALHVEASELGEGQLRLRIAGLSFVVELDGDRAWVGDGCLAGEVVDLRALALRQARSKAEQDSGSATIVAPMAGKVAAILVAEGQQVSAGEGLLVIEAMKMENELRAPKNGIVRGLKPQLGGAVDLGATLCRVE